MEDSDDNNEDYSDDDDEEDDDIPEGEGRQYDAYNSTDGLPAGKYIHIYIHMCLSLYIDMFDWWIDMFDWWVDVYIRYIYNSDYN